MTKQELIEQAAFEAYPENKGYSIVFGKVIDYNYFNRKPYQAGLEKGWQMAIDKAYEWFEENLHMYNTSECEGDRIDFVEDFKKAMEEQL